MAKTFSEWIATLSAVTGLGAGDKVPVVESGVTKYVEGDDFGGGITALTGDVTASGAGSVAATIANLAVTNAKVATGIDAVKIADGSVTNAEFQYLGGVTSDLQTQINAKQTSDATLTAFAALTIAADSLTIGTGADAFSQTPFAANTFPAKASTGSLEAKTITDFGLSLVNDADASTARTTLGLGTLATQSGTFSGTSSGTNTGDQTNITGNAGTVTVADAGADTTTWVLLGTAQTGSLAPATDAGLTYNATTNALTATTFIGALTGNADTVTGFSGTSSGNNTGDQTITNSSDATSHTVTLSASGGSVQLVEGSGVTLTTTGTGSAGIVTIAASGGDTVVTVTETITGIDGANINIISGITTAAYLVKLRCVVKCIVQGAGTVAVNEAYTQNYENALLADGVFENADSGYHNATDNMGDALIEPLDVDSGVFRVYFTAPSLAAADTQFQIKIVASYISA